MRSDLARRSLVVVLTILAASIAASFVSGALFGIWVTSTAFFDTRLVSRNLADIASAAATWTFFSTLFGNIVTLPLVILGAGVGHLILRFIGGRPSRVLPVGGFIVGTLVWLAFVARPNEQPVPIPDEWSAPVVGGIAGLVAGLIVSRLWT